MDEQKPPLFRTTPDAWNRMLAAIQVNKDISVMADFSALMNDYTRAQIVIKALDQALIEVGRRGELPNEEVIAVLQSHYDLVDNDFKDQINDAKREAAKLAAQQE